MIVFWALLMQACFSITEEYTFNKDGSGQYNIHLQFEEKIADFVNTMSAFDTSAKEAGPEEMFGAIDSQMRESMALMETLDGVKNVSVKFDSADFKMTLQAEFDNLKALNNLLNVDPDEEFGFKKEPTQYFALEKNKLTRENTVKDLLSSMDPGEDSALDMQDESTKALLKLFELKYSIIYNMPSQVESVDLAQKDGGSVEVEDNKVTLEFDFTQLLENGADIGHTVYFK